MSLGETRFYKMNDFELPIVKSTVHSEYSGFIGLGSVRLDKSDDNFLLQLQKKQIIDHLVFAFYMGSDCADGKSSCSTIKFGSYDEINIKPGTDLEMIATKAYNTWDLSHDRIQVGTLDPMILT